MIQELLGGVLERKNLSDISPSCLLLNDAPTPTPVPSSSFTSSSTSPTNLPPSSSSPATATTPFSTSDPRENNLRCPRCDSSNTKFCYYNNYNLTQPRHFCKSCRRYWTKGGALRNVPIGGGCRKTKPSISADAVSKSGCVGADGKPNTPNELVQNPNILLASPHGAHLLGLLRGAGFQNPNPNMIPQLSSFKVKEDEDATLVFSTIRSAEVDPLWRNPNAVAVQLLSQKKQQQADVGEECVQVGDMYQKIRVSSVFCNENLQNIGGGGGYMGVFPAAFGGTSGASPALLEQVPHSAKAREFGYWNPTPAAAAAYSWSDLPAAANGAFL